MRRIVSIVLYVIGGWMLTGEGVIAFVRSEDQTMMLAVLGFAALFPLVFIGLGAWASPGARLREVGLTLLITAGFTAYAMGSMIYMMNMPDTRHLFPRDTRFAFDGYWLGGANLIVMAGLGWLLYRRPRRDPGSRAPVERRAR